MHLDLTFAGGDSGLDLSERLAANVENMARFLEEESSCFESGSVCIHLANLQRLASISWQASQVRKSAMPRGLRRQARQAAMIWRAGTRTNPPAIP